MLGFLNNYIVIGYRRPWWMPLWSAFFIVRTYTLERAKNRKINDKVKKADNEWTSG